MTLQDSRPRLVWRDGQWVIRTQCTLINQPALVFVDWAVPGDYRADCDGLVLADRGCGTYETEEEVDGRQLVWRLPGNQKSLQPVCWTVQKPKLVGEWKWESHPYLHEYWWVKRLRGGKKVAAPWNKCKLEEQTGGVA